MINFKESSLKQKIILCITAVFIAIFLGIETKEDSPVLKNHILSFYNFNIGCDFTAKTLQLSETKYPIRSANVIGRAALLGKYRYMLSLAAFLTGFGLFGLLKKEQR